MIRSATGRWGWSFQGRTRGTNQGYIFRLMPQPKKNKFMWPRQRRAGMLQQVATILGFGFVGLSFLMLYLGYRQMNLVLSQPDTNQDKIGLSRFFLKISLVFLIVAGPLQWANVIVDHFFSDRVVELVVAVPSSAWEPEFGRIGIVRRGEPMWITPEKLTDTFKDNEAVIVEVSEVVDAFRKMRGQIQITTRELVVSSSDEGGGF
jgi:hypothetical protein